MAIPRPIGYLLDRFYADNSVELTWDLYDAFCDGLLEMVKHCAQVKGDTQDYTVRSAQLHMMVANRFWKRLHQARSQRDPTKSNKRKHKLKFWHDDALAFIRLYELFAGELHPQQREACQIAFNQIAKNYI